MCASYSNVRVHSSPILRISFFCRFASSERVVMLMSITSLATGLDESNDVSFHTKMTPYPTCLLVTAGSLTYRICSGSRHIRRVGGRFEPALALISRCRRLRGLLSEKDTYLKIALTVEGSVPKRSATHNLTGLYIESELFSHMLVRLLTCCDQHLTSCSLLLGRHFPFHWLDQQQRCLFNCSQGHRVTMQRLGVTH